MKIVTFNLRVDIPLDENNMFKNRKGLILEKIDTEMPDVIGFQEMLPHMRDFLIKHLPDYQFVGKKPQRGFYGEHMDIAFRRDKYDIIGLDCFWLSPTPMVPGSRYEEQSEYPRIVTSAVLREIKTNRLFRFINTHLDHEGDLARILGMKQIIKYVEQENAKFCMPYFMTGDFNALPDSETIRFCKDNGMFELTECITESTYHDFGRDERNDFKIDYIFCDSDTAKLPYKITMWKDCNFGLYLSDHYPLCCEIDF